MITTISLRGRLPVVILLTAVALMIYANTFEAPFVFDDLPNITQAPHIRMTEITLDKIIDGTRGPSPFRPIAYLSFTLNYYFNRYDTTGYHIVNIGIHIAVAVLVFIIAGHTLRLTGIARGIIPEMTALLWLAHPLHTQSVTYTVQRVNLLTTLFFMLGLYLYIRARLARQSDKNGHITTGFFFSGCIISGLLALFSKENAAILPMFIFLYEWFFFQNLDPIWRGKKTKLILLGAGTVLVITALYLKADPMNRILASYTNKDFSPAERLLTQPQVVVYYLSLLFFPHPARLNVDYDFPLSTSLIHPPATVLSLLAITALAAAALHRPKRHRLFSFAILWFLGNLAIESSVIGLALIFEHRTYLPSLFTAFIFTALLLRHLPRWFSTVTLSVIIVISCIWTYQRNAVWGDTLMFWQDCAQKSPARAKPANGIGTAFQARHQPEKALEWFQKAVQLDPDYDIAHNNIGGILIRLGRPAEAVPHLERAIALDTQNYQAFSNLGSAMHRLNRIDEAIAYYQKSMRVFPDYEVAHNNLGAVLTETGDIEGAIRHLNRAIQINPGYPDAFNNLGLAMTKLGRTQAAINYYQQALQLEPEYALALFNLGTVWFHRQNLDRARDYLQQAVRLDPQFVGALHKLAAILAMQRQYNAAVEVLSRLAELQPDNPTVFYNLSCAYALQNKKENAVDALKKAVALGYDRWDHLRSDKDLDNISDTAFYINLTKQKLEVP